MHASVKVLVCAVCYTALAISVQLAVLSTRISPLPCWDSPLSEHVRWGLPVWPTSMPTRMSRPEAGACT